MQGGPVEATAGGRKVRIQLPPGLREGDTVRVGAVLLPVSLIGDFEALVRGHDLWLTIRLPASTLADGGRSVVETPIGRKTLWISRQAAERRLLRLPDQGLPARGPHPAGHLFLRLEADAASKAESPARTLLRRFAAAGRPDADTRRIDTQTPVLVASIAAGLSYMGSWNLDCQPVSLAWKGAGVGLLAVYAALRARNADGWLLAAVMAFGALGDVLLNEHNMIPGALAFLAGHLIAVVLYLRNRRPSLTRSQTLPRRLAVRAVPALAYMLPLDRAGAPAIALYASGLGLMAAAAWISRFPRFVVGLGALMFVVSDLLIFARAGRYDHSLLAGLAVWSLYYFGQMMIAVGVSAALTHGAEPTPRQ